MSMPDFVPPQQNQGPRDNIMPRFYIEAVQNNFRSEREGKPVYDDVEMIELIVAGDRNTVVTERVKEEHRQRWANQYLHFKQGLEPPVDGTPIEHWAAITPATALNLKANNVRTVEQLAELPDALLTKAVPIGGFDLRKRAKAAVEQAAGNAPMDALIAELKKANETISALRQQLTEVGNQSLSKEVTDAHA